MIKHVITFTLLIFAICMVNAPVFAQPGGGDQGEIESVRYEILVDKENTVPDAKRNFEKIPPRPQDSSMPSVEYNVRNILFDASDIAPSMRPLRLNDQETSKNYGNYVRGGLGNYGATYFDGYMTTRKNNKRLLGVNFFHKRFGKGSVDNKNSGFQLNSLKTFGKFFLQRTTVDVYGQYSHQAGYFYGYPKTSIVPSRSSIAQTSQLYTLGGEVKNTLDQDIDYNLGIQVSHLKDSYAAKETEVDVAFEGDYLMKNDNHVKLAMDYAMIIRKDSDVKTETRHLFRMTPQYFFSPIEKLNIWAGFRVAYSNDSVDKKFHIYPMLKAQYALGERSNVFASLSGDLEKTTLKTLRNDNFWITSNIDVYHRNKRYEAKLWINSHVGRRLRVEGGLGLSAMKNMSYFQNLLFQQSAFDVYYDSGNTRRLNIFMEATYALTQTFSGSLKAEWNRYNTGITNIIKNSMWNTEVTVTQANVPIHVPTYRAEALLKADINRKIVLEGSFIALGGIKYINYEASDNQKLRVTDIPVSLNLRFSFEYWISKRIAAFINLDNVLSKPYSRYQYYPERGFQGMGGLSWSF